MKYIRFEEIGFVLFPNNIRITTHKKIKDSVNKKVISAGFVGFNETSFICYDESTSLHKSSKEEDSELLTRQVVI